jgi:hypothetical protein
MIIDGKDYIVNRIYMTLEEVKEIMEIQVEFRTGISTREVFVLTGEEMKDFYRNWNNNSYVYKTLCIKLGVDPNIVPEDMDGEILG